MLEITEHPDLLTPQSDNGGQGTYITLADKLSMRSIYITPLNIIQVANLKRLRDIEEGRVDERTLNWTPTHAWAQQMFSIHVSKDYYHAAVREGPHHHHEGHRRRHAEHGVRGGRYRACICRLL